MKMIVTMIFCRLFDDASDGGMIDELETIWKEAVVA
jgi:hypothetical protein